MARTTTTLVYGATRFLKFPIPYLSKKWYGDFMVKTIEKPTLGIGEQSPSLANLAKVSARLLSRRLHAETR